jgi:hypothetical protein
MKHILLTLSTIATLSLSVFAGGLPASDPRSPCFDQYIYRQMERDYHQHKIERQLQEIQEQLERINRE